MPDDQLLQDGQRGQVEHVVGVHVGGLVGQHHPLAVLVQQPDDLGVHDHHGLLAAAGERVGHRVLGHVQGRHRLVVEHVVDLALELVDVRQLVVAQAHRGAELAVRRLRS